MRLTGSRLCLSTSLEPAGMTSSSARARGNSSGKRARRRRRLLWVTSGTALRALEYTRSSVKLNPNSFRHLVKSGIFPDNFANEAPISAEWAGGARDETPLQRFGITTDMIRIGYNGRHEQSWPVRLGDLIRDGKLLWLYCRECYRERDVDPATIPLPPDLPVLNIGKHMKCSKCGSRKIDSRPELCPGGLEAQRGRRRHR
jgi:hypothetical protein